MWNEPERLNWRFVETAIFVFLRVARRKNWLKPADLTELRLAAENRTPPDPPVPTRIARLLAETWAEKEERKDTPRKPD